jgi:tRNA-dihydrouridine synthase
MSKDNSSNLFFSSNGNLTSVDLKKRIFDSAPLMIGRAILGNPATTQTGVHNNISSSSQSVQSVANEKSSVRDDKTTDIDRSIQSKQLSLDAKIPDDFTENKVIEMCYEDIVTAYRVFLRRLPESTNVVHSRVGATRERLLTSFLMSEEFLQHTSHLKILFDIAKSVNLKILSEKVIQNK